jgi:hypothetical protein
VAVVKQPTAATSSNEMIHIEDGERVYPCRCGETHRGPYGGIDFDHHNCLHEAPLFPVAGDEGHFLCSCCGASFFTEERWAA